MRRIKQAEIDGLCRALEIVTGRLNALRMERAYAVGAMEQYRLSDQIAAAERERAALILQITELEKEFERCPIDNLPVPRNPYWIDRSSEQADFHEQIEAQRVKQAARGDRGPVYCCCNGLPGVGKTQFILEYARSRLGSAYQSVVWIDGTGSDLRNATAKATRELNFVPGENPTDDQLIDALRKHLAEGGPHLVVFDNVDVPSAIGRHLP